MKNRSISIIISLCMIFQLIQIYTVTAKEYSAEGTEYIVNDQFATGTDGWVAGEVHSSKTKAALSNASRYTDRDGVTANGLLKIDFAAGDGSWIWNANAAQSAYREFDTPYTYKAGTNIIVKTRILQTCTGDGATFRFLHNSPNSATVNSISGNNEAPDNRPHSDGSYYYNDYLLFNTRKNGSGSDVCYPLNYHKEEDGNKGTILHSATADNLKNRWIDVEMVINGTGNTAIIKATANGVTETGTVNIEQEAQVYMNKYGTNGSGNPNQSVFSALESFTIQQGVTADAVTVYVDYVEVYEQLCIINDQFSEGTDGWVVGAINGSLTTPAKMTTVSSYTDANGVAASGVLKVDIGTPAEYSVGGQPNIFRGLDIPYTYKDNKDLVIKTRVLHTSSSGRFDLMHNRYNTIDTDATGASITDNAFSGHYMLFDVQGSSNNLSYPSGVSENTVNETQLISTGNLANKWIDVEMVIDGKNDQMTITATVDGMTETATTSITQPNSVYIRDGADPATGWTTPLKAHFDELKSLTFLQRSGEDTIYIDYVTAYEQIGAEMDVEPSYAPGMPIIVTFDTKVGTEDFKDALELYDVNNNKVTTVNTIDGTNKIVTLTPNVTLTNNAEYVVKIKSGVLPGIYGIKETQKRFLVSSRVYIINDKFSLDNSGWVAGAGDSAPTLTNVASYTDKDGVTANGLLKIDFTGTGGNWDSKPNQTAHRAFGAPYTYKDDVNVVIKTRILQTDASGTFGFLHNKPNTATTGQVPGDYPNASPYDAIRPGAYYYNDYLLFYAKRDASSSDLRYGTGYNPSGNILNTATADNLTDRWIDVTMIIDGKKNNMTITATANGVTELVKNVDLTQNDAVYRNKYGTDGSGNPNQKFFDALESLSIQQRNSANTVYVDYVEVYAETTYSELVDSSDNVLSVLEKNTTVKPRFVIGEAFAGNNNKYLVMSAKYVGGKVADTHLYNIDTHQATYTDPVGYTLGDNVGDVVIKTFIWNAKTLEPLYKVKEYTSDVVYVATPEDGGNDSNPGTKGSPVASISQAVNLANDKSKNVVVRGGDYYISEPIEFGEGYEGMTIVAEQGETPVVTTGIAYKFSDATKVTDENILSRLNESYARNFLYELDLTKDGKIAVGDIPAVGYPGTDKYGDKEKSTCGVIFGDQEMTIARWPNAVNDNYPYATIDSVNQLENSFTITSERAAARMAKWANAVASDPKNQPLMFGYWGKDWATQTLPIAGINAGTNTISSGGNSKYTAKAGQRFYVFNLLEEIDDSYEYFIDRTTGKLYFYMSQSASPDTKIVLTLNDSAFNIGADNTVINGINIGGSGSVGMNIWGNNIQIKNCTIENTQGYAISANGDNNVFDNCVIKNVDGGIYIGDLKNRNYINTLTKAKNVIKNCEISNFSKLSKTYKPAIRLEGVGNTALNNRIHDSEHMAITFSGCYHTIKYNEIYNVCTETNDAGAIYVGRTWLDRENKIISNYFHDISTSSTETADGHEVGAIFLDDHYAGAYIKGNVFVNIEGCAVRGNSGREHTITNNVFENCNTGVRISNREWNYTNEYSAQMAELETIRDSSNARYPVWSVTFKSVLYDPDLSSFYENSGNSATKNLFVNCTKDIGRTTGKISTSSNKTKGSISSYAVTSSTSEISGFETIEFGKMGRNKNN